MPEPPAEPSVDTPGLDLAALARWLDAEHPGLRAGDLVGEVVAGGKSNLTYRVTDGTRTWALRRPPLAHVLPTAHDMAREFRVISALARTPVPVPSPIALCEDAEVLGAPFYLMSFVDAVVLDTPEVPRRVTPPLAGAACEHLMDTLLTLHAVDPGAVGLSGFGHPDGFLSRQVRRWHKQWQASRTRELDDLDRVVTRLAQTLPAQSAAAIVHGDYRLTNVMYRPDLSGIAAVVDWEMATLGDPLTDLGLLAVYQNLSGEDGFVAPRITPGDGFWSTEQLVARYAAGTDRDLTRLDWYIGLGYFKLAVISEGIHHRYLAGKTVGPGFENFGAGVPRLLADALRTMARR